MEIDIQIVQEPIMAKISPPKSVGAHGAWIEFRGVVRGEEAGNRISALEYEAYPEMAQREIRRLLTEIAANHPCLAAKVVHRTGIIPVGDTAIYVGIASAHRAEGIALLAKFMDRLKQDVPIWKRKGLAENVSIAERQSAARLAMRSLGEARGEIYARCQTLPAVRVSLNEAVGRVLQEEIRAAEDLPSSDRSTRDGYAVLENDASEVFQVVDAIHAADWKPRQLKMGEAVRIATGAALPCENVRVVMQEHVERTGDQIRITKRESGSNIRKRGEDMRAGQSLVREGTRLDAGTLALLATVGCAKPLVSPRLRVMHYTTGDEIVAPDQTPKPGQIRDSNSILIRGLLERFGCEVYHEHLPEDFERAKVQIGNPQLVTNRPYLILVSGGASVGDKDFTRPLLEWLGFEVIFNQVNVRPGRPLIFGLDGPRVAFGIPGNPLSHFACFHAFIVEALAKMIGQGAKPFSSGKLAAKLDDAANPRETLWPARLDGAGLHALAWASSGDITCLVETNALIRIPANTDSIEAGASVDYLLTDF